MTELDVLAIVGDRLTANGVAFMLTGSFAMAHYTTPRASSGYSISCTASELQRRDVSQLLGGPVDVECLRKWAAVLGVESALEDVQR